MNEDAYLESYKKNELDQHTGKVLIVAFFIVIAIGVNFIPDRWEYLLGIGIMTFGALGMGYIFGFERGKKVANL